MTRLRLICVCLVLLFGAEAVSGETRVAAVGTSLTQRGDWPEILARTLASCVEGDVAVQRFAAAGRGSDWGVSQLDRVISAKPAIVLVEFAINDADVLDGVSLSVSRKNHEEIVDRLRAANREVAVFLVTTNPVDGPRGWVRPFLAEYYQLYREIARAKAVGLIDLHAVWRATLAAGDRDRLIPDGLHPAEAAFVRVALPVIREHLSRFLGAPSAGCF